MKDADESRGRSALFRSLLGQSLEQLVARGLAERIATGLRWGEGPAYLPAADLWIFSDIPNNRILGWNRKHGVHNFRSPSDFANGNTTARDGSLLTCEHGGRRISRTDPSGAYTVLCSAFNGSRLNSPNDIIEHKDGSIWFSDPSYGILSDIEGYRAPSEQSANRVYRYDPASGHLSAQISTLRMPNGLCMSPDGRTLYVADSGADMGPSVRYDPNGPADIHAFSLSATGQVLLPGRLFVRVSKGVPDGIRCDEEGYLWVATGLGLECFDANGGRIGAIETPETLANLCFGGSDGMSMLLTLVSSVYLLGKG